MSEINKLNTSYKLRKISGGSAVIQWQILDKSGAWRETSQTLLRFLVQDIMKAIGIDAQVSHYLDYFTCTFEGAPVKIEVETLDVEDFDGQHLFEWVEMATVNYVKAMRSVIVTQIDLAALVERQTAMLAHYQSIGRNS
jgi:hypothetical protein